MIKFDILGQNFRIEIEMIKIEYFVQILSYSDEIF